MDPTALQSIISQIRTHHRERQFAIHNRKRADQALGSFLRGRLGWVRNGDLATNAFATRRAAELIRIGERVLREQSRRNGNPGSVEGSTDPDYLGCEVVILAALQARAPFDQIEKRSEKRMARLVQDLPIHAWASQVPGLGDIGLAMLIAEAGDLSRFRTPAKLWKRMGVALGENEKGEWVRQGGLKRGVPNELWVAHGYNPKRRSLLFMVGDALIKRNGDGDYRKLFLERKEYERRKAADAGLKVAPAARIPRGKAREYRSDGHIHLRAQRYMEKRLLRDLWTEWVRLHGRWDEHAPAVLPAPLEEAA